MNHLRAFQTVGEDLFNAGLNNSHSGNLSMRSTRMMAITRTGSMLHRLAATDIIETLIDGEDAETKRASREIPVHRAIYLGTGANAIVHAHTPHAIALAFLYDRLTPCDSEGGYYFPEGVPVLEVKNAIASHEVAAAIVPLLKLVPIVVVRGHGTFAIGADLEEAFHWTSSFDHSAHILLLAHQAGTLRA
ncbi:MAG TPA: class II aldolase/adducin family protein [Candidatus Ozemobacteraceae bacterium]|nr:class II aldolase/adducin family protein [Candidatus Ozemobacteraceae bacterium]